MKILDSNSPPSPLSSRREGWRPKGDGVSYISNKQQVTEWALSEGGNKRDGGKLPGEEVQAYKQVIPGFGPIRAEFQL